MLEIARHTDFELEEKIQYIIDRIPHDALCHMEYELSENYGTDWLNARM